MSGIRRYRRPVVQLTSLLDLLFVMIFVSLLQTKAIPPKNEVKPLPEVNKVASIPVPQTKQKTGKIAVSAIFNFFGPTTNPGLPKGSYKMEGTYNQETGFLQLGGVEWIDRPTHYEMVPLKGKIDQDQKVFVGNIEFPDCREFKLKRNTQASGSPVAGNWEGVYVCSQGETGLKLTLQ